MEKIIYVIWKRESDSGNDLRRNLLQETSSKLLDMDVRKLSVSVADDDVAPAASLRTLATIPPISGIVSVWVDTAVRCRPLEAALRETVARVAGRGRTGHGGWCTGRSMKRRLVPWSERDS